MKNLFESALIVFMSNALSASATRLTARTQTDVSAAYEKYELIGQAAHHEAYNPALYSTHVPIVEGAKIWNDYPGKSDKKDAVIAKIQAWLDKKVSGADFTLKPGHCPNGNDGPKVLNDLEWSLRNRRAEEEKIPKDQSEVDRHAKDFYQNTAHLIACLSTN